MAAEKGLKEVVEFLVKKDANIYAISKNEYTPLHLAAEKSHIDIVRYLVEKGAYIDTKDENKYRYTKRETPLHLAAEKGYTKVVKYLIKKGIDVNAKDENGQTSLWKAVEYGHKKVIMILLAEGANSLLRNNHDKVLINLAESDEIRKIFEGASELQKMKKEIIDERGRSILDFLTADEASYTHNSKLFEELQKNKEQYKKDYPTFAEMIDDQYKAIEERRSLEKEALEPLGCLGAFKEGKQVKEIWEVVNEDSCHSIATYLEKVDLKILINSRRRCE